MTPLLTTALLRTQSDERLVALAASGHERAFEAIVERHRRPIMRHCRRYLPDARAEDAVQQVFLSAWAALNAGTDVRDLAAWLHRIARNTAINAVQRRGYDYDALRDSLEAPAGDPSDDLERRQVMRHTLAGLAALPDNQREALLRTALAGDSRADIARQMGLSEGAVRQLVHRARTALRTAATAVTPLPLAGWAAGGRAGDLPSRIAELVTGAGAAGGAATLAKAGTVVVVAGALATSATTGPLHRGGGTRDEGPGVAHAAEKPKGNGGTKARTGTSAQENIAAVARSTADRPAKRATRRSATTGTGGQRSGRGGGGDDSGSGERSVSGSHDSGSDDRTSDHSGSSGDDHTTEPADDHSGSSGSGSGSDAPPQTDTSGSGSGTSGVDDHPTTAPVTTTPEPSDDSRDTPTTPEGGAITPG